MITGSIYKLDWSQVNLRGGFVTVLVIVAVALVLALFGTLGIAVGLATLFVMIADTPGSLRSRLVAVLTFSFVGALLAFGGAWAGSERPVLASLLMAAVVYLATIAAARGKSAAVRWLLLSIWVVMVISLSSGVEQPIELSLAFLGGGLLAGIGIAVRGWFADVDDEGDLLPPISVVFAEMRTPLGRFAVVRGLAAGIATYLGVLIFPEFPVWVVIAVLIILREERGATIDIGVLRTLGTLLGVAVASGVLVILGEYGLAVIAAFLFSGFAMIALQKVNYAVFSLFLTAMLVFALHVRGEDALEGGIARLLATLLGVAIAFGGILVTTADRTST
jgi:hypothetical protein